MIKIILFKLGILMIMLINSLKKLTLNLALVLLNILFLLDPVVAKVVHIKIAEANDIGIKIILLPVNNNIKYNDFKSLTRIIKDDLNYSGQFKILEFNPQDPNVSQKIPDQINDIDYKFWRDTGAEYLLITKLYPSSNTEQLIINLKLIDLYKPLNPIHLNKEIIKDPNENNRKFAHKLSGIIFDDLTGMRNFFTTKIAYIRAKNLGTDHSEYSLNSIDFDGHNEEQLFSAKYPLMSPSWSPDGKKIAFVSFYNNRSNISIMDLDTRKIKIFSKYPGINGAPSWSPDGESLALVLSKDGSPKIYIMNLANRSINRITNGIAIDTEPCWSKDGKDVFFTSNRGGKPQIYKVELSSGIVKRVTFSGEYNATPVLTPDNKYLVMLHCNENCNKNNPKFNIAVQSLESGKIKVLTTMSAMNESPAVAPNGIMVAYSSQVAHESNKALAKISIGGYCNQNILIAGNSKDNLKSPSWSPFLE